MTPPPRRVALVRAALAAALLALALALALGACDGDSDSEPRALLDEAAEKRIESGEVRIRLKFTLDGLAILGPSTVIDAWGPIRWSGAGALPALDWKLLVLGGGSSIPARMRSTGENLFVEFQGRDYEAGPTLLPWLFDDAERPGPGQRGGVSLEQLLGTSPAGWIEDPEIRDGEEIGGDPTREIAGALDVEAAVSDLREVLADDAPPEGQGALGGRLRPLRELEGDDLERLADAVERAQLRVSVDEEGYPRRLFARIDFETPQGVELEGIRGGTVDVEVVLERIGAQVDVEPPRNPLPLTSLLRSLGAIFGIEALEDAGS